MSMLEIYKGFSFLGGLTFVFGLSIWIFLFFFPVFDDDGVISRMLLFVYMFLSFILLFTSCIILSEHPEVIEQLQEEKQSLSVVLYLQDGGCFNYECC